MFPSSSLGKDQKFLSANLLRIDPQLQLGKCVEDSIYNRSPERSVLHGLGFYSIGKRLFQKKGFIGCGHFSLQAIIDSTKLFVCVDQHSNLLHQLLVEPLTHHCLESMSANLMQTYSYSAVYRKVVSNQPYLVVVRDTTNGGFIPYAVEPYVYRQVCLCLHNP